MQKNKNHSYNIGKLCHGCKQCVKGRKIVVYITGICPRQCFYCPLSDQKKDKDVIYANERLCANEKIDLEKENNALKNIIQEAKISKSKGAGITGGDPLARLSRTIKLIKLFKKEFEIDKLNNNKTKTKFHIHLYTSLDLVNKKNLKKLYDSGLDEIRFHPDLYDEKFWDRIKIAKEIGNWKIGVEIPAIPNNYDMTIKLINHISSYVDFLNINELEISDSNGNQLLEMNYICKNEKSYAIKGSHEMALKLLKEIKNKKLKNKENKLLPVHYCTSKLKDSVQMANRIKIRAKSIKKPYEVITEDGMLILGIIKLNWFDMKKVKKIVDDMIKVYNLPKKLIEIDEKRKAICIAPWVLDELSEELKEVLKDNGIKCIIQTEYPTWDRMIVESFEI